MTKKELHNQVTTLLEEYEAQFKSKKAFNEFKSSIDDLIKPKSGGGVLKNAPITIDDITYHYCRYTGYYLPKDEMVMSKGKSKGYSKKAIAKWNKLGRDIKSMNEKAMKLLLDKEFEEGEKLAQEVEELKNKRNYVSSYEDVRKEYEDIKLNQES